MTRDRIYGEDTPFGRWMREQGRIAGTMPSSAFVSSDCDYMIHRYKTVVDGYGTRDVQALMILEVKTNGAKPRFAQVDSMWLMHLCANTNKPRRKVEHSGKVVFHHGVSFLSMSGTTPDNSQVMQWGRFERSASIGWRNINTVNLIDLMMFDIHPDNFERNPYRRHHKSQTIERMVMQPLNFPAWEVVTQRS
jgi:hypothetical protein